VNLRQIPEINKMMEKIDEVQENQDLNCNCGECYWNMWNPYSKYWNNEESKICVSESLTYFKMTPNSTDCKGYWSYEEACGRKKGQ
jgi:hypothetical protein